MSNGIITSVSGPLVVAEGIDHAKIRDLCYVGEQGLVGEIIQIRGKNIYIQVYEETSMVGPGEPVVPTGAPLSVELGPGLLTGMFDGIQRPLEKLAEVSGNSFLDRGARVDSLDREKVWSFKALVENGTEVEPGDIIGEVPETATISHKIMVPMGVSGTIQNLADGDFHVADTLYQVTDAKGNTTDHNMIQKSPIRQGRAFKAKQRPDRPLITGQRVIDTLFPVVKGEQRQYPVHSEQVKQSCNIKSPSGQM